MNLKEYNNLLDETSNFIKPLNQILYQILILITIYLLFNKLKTNQTENQKQNTSINTKTHKSFIILFAILVVGLDWFIWNNTIQTTLFICILTVYIYYNFQNLNIISTFINFTKTLSDSAPIITELSPNTNENKEHSEIPVLPIPDIFINANDTPLPFDINSTETKEINEVYKSDKPYVSITDTKYAEIMLNDLYNTPQYKNIQNDEIDTTLDNNIHFTTNKIDFEYNKNNEELLNSFRNPKKEFLDASWLNKKKNTYNDNCIGCKSSNNKSSNNKNKNRGKNAICSVVNFGRELSECTNQEGSVNPEQLDKISNNQVKPLFI
jgi:hypothetical protein